MSEDTLPSVAPEESVAVVDDMAPAESPEVPVGSLDSSDVIPKERFNGLMAKYQSEKAEWEAQQEALLNELDTMRSFKAAESEVEEVSDERVLDELQALRAELAAQKLETARAEAIAQYPEAAPLADLIVGNSPKEIHSMAAEIANRLSGIKGAEAPASEAPATDAAAEVSSEPVAETPPAEVPTIGGASAFQSDVPIDEAIGAALEAKDFSAFIAAAARRAELNAE